MSLVLKGVGLQYSGASEPILRDVDLVVEPGDTVAIIGPSGSGKTTLLSILGGLLVPSMGEVFLESAATRTPSPGVLAWVFQTVNLIGRRSALDNVAIGLYPTGMLPSEVAGPASAMLKTVGLESVETRTAKSLSGGEAQRVGIARALVGRPRYVLADEPTGQLDRATSELVASVLFAARPAETAIVTVTHDPLVASYCTRRFSLVHGRLVAVA